MKKVKSLSLFLVFLLGLSINLNLLQAQESLPVEVYDNTLSFNLNSFDSNIAPSYIQLDRDTTSISDIPQTPPDNEPVGAWQNIFTENFDGSWPGLWDVSDGDSMSLEDTWAPVACGPIPTSGSYSCWCAGSGDMPACGSYDTYQLSWMIYGPFSLADANSARMTFNYMNDSEVNYDSLHWTASIDGLNFYGTMTDGTTSGYPITWQSGVMDFTNVYTLGNICGESQVWIAFIFVSDLSITYGGAYIDDVAIQKDPNSTPLPDLRPYQVSGWDDTIVVSTTTGTTTSATTIYDTDNIYLDFSCLNDSTVDITTSFNYGIYVDGSLRLYVARDSGMLASNYSYVLDADIGTLSAGSHTIEIRCDYNSEVSEADESNNSYTRTINVISQDPNSEIYGYKWKDDDGNGIWDSNESGLADWEIYLDTNQNCTYDTGEPYTLTGVDGSYSFTSLQPGSYIVAEIQQTDCTQTFPSASGQPSAPATLSSNMTEAQLANLEYQIQDSPPQPPVDAVRPVQSLSTLSASAVMLNDVPTTTWTYGCSATSAGMLFGYYDRTGYSDMYTGPTNGGVCPLTDLGQGDIPSSPITGACSIIATQNGFDGRTTVGHVDNYWIGYNSAGPDPWETGGTEHTWGECTADYMGTNQWKWDVDNDGTNDSNVDGATTYYFYSNGTKLYDYTPSSTGFQTATALCHGMRLFAESRGYTVIENYNQVIDAYSTDPSNGYTFADFQAEIDNERPVLIHVTGHTMIGVGYEASTSTVYLHDTWDNSVHTMTWGGDYSGMTMQAVTVLVLEDAAGCPGTHNVNLSAGEIAYDINFGNQCASDPECGDWGYYNADLNEDCYVNIFDFALFASEWLECSDPTDIACTTAQ